MKKVKKKGLVDKTYRFTIHRTDDQYQFNWLDLIADEADKKKPPSMTPLTNLDPYASDDDEQLKALARKYEAKYGTGDDIRKRKKARTVDDYADLGYGYDSNDPFIDNSEIHDEIVPQNMTTAHGGFYVNTGPLEFKARESADEDSDMEAIIQEGEKAAKKRKYRRKEDEEEIDEIPRKKKKFKKVKASDGSVKIVPVSESKSGNDSAGKQKPKQCRPKKEAAKPPGRPKKRNPDGSLVHPPKLSKVRNPILLNNGPPAQSFANKPAAKVINVKTASGKKQVMKVTTPGGARKNVIEFSSRPSSSTTTNTSSIAQLKKTTESPANSTAKDQVVRDAQVKMLANTVDSLMQSIPPPIKAGTTLAGGATISPASMTNAANGKTKKVTGAPKVSVTATSTKAKTVKEQLNEARRNQEEKKAKERVEPPKYDLNKALDYYEKTSTSAAKATESAIANEKSVSAKDRKVEKPTTSSSAMLQQQQNAKKKSTNIQPKNKQAARQAMAAFNAQQYVDMFNLQGASNMAQIQSLLAQASGTAFYQEFLNMAGVSQAAATLSNAKNESKTSPVSAAKSPNIPSNLSIESLSKSSLQNQSDSKRTSNSSTPTSSVNKMKGEMSTMSDQRISTSSPSTARSQGNETINKVQQRSDKTIDNLSDKSDQRHLGSEKQGTSQQNLDLMEAQRRQKQQLQEQQNEEALQKKLLEIKRKEEALLKHKMELKMREEEAAKKREEMRQREMERQRRQQEEAKIKMAQEEARRRQAEQMKAKQEAEAKKKQELLRQQIEFQKQEGLRLEQQKQAELRKKQEEAARLEKQRLLEQQRQQQEAARRLEQQRQEARRLEQQKQEARRLEQQKQEALRIEKKKQAELQQKQEKLRLEKQKQEQALQRQKQQQMLQQQQQQQQHNQISVISPNRPTANNPFASMQPISQSQLQKTSIQGLQQQPHNSISISPPKAVVVQANNATAVAGSPQQKNYSLANNSFSNNATSKYTSNQQQSLILNSQPSLQSQRQVSRQNVSFNIVTSPQQQQTSPPVNVQTFYSPPLSAGSANVSPANNVSFNVQSSPSSISQILNTSSPTSIPQSTLDQILSSPTSSAPTICHFVPNSSPQAKISTVSTQSGGVVQQQQFSTSNISTQNVYTQRAMPAMATLEKTVAQQFQANSNNPGYYTIQK